MRLQSQVNLLYCIYKLEKNTLRSKLFFVYICLRSLTKNWNKSKLEKSDKKARLRNTAQNRIQSQVVTRASNLAQSVVLQRTQVYSEQ